MEYYGIRKKVNMKHSKITFNQESERCLEEHTSAPMKNADTDYEALLLLQ